MRIEKGGPLAVGCGQLPHFKEEEEVEKENRKDSRSLSLYVYRLYSIYPHCFYHVLQQHAVQYYTGRRFCTCAGSRRVRRPSSSHLLLFLLLLCFQSFLVYFCFVFSSDNDFFTCSFSEEPPFLVSLSLYLSISLLVLFSRPSSSSNSFSWRLLWDCR